MWGRRLAALAGAGFECWRRFRWRRLATLAAGIVSFYMRLLEYSWYIHVSNSVAKDYKILLVER